MRVFRPASFVLSSLLISVCEGAQQVPPRYAQAIAVLQQSLVAMGGTLPSDSVATAPVVLVAGSLTENGTIRILTRGVDQSAEQIQTAAGTRAVIYSRGRANEIEGGSVKRLWLELVVTSQSPNFPLPLVFGALNNPDTGIQYIGLETLDGLGLHHIRLWTAFSSTPRLQRLAEFSTRDLWISASGGLPYKLQYNRRAAGGSAPQIPVAVYFSDYRAVGGVLYPFVIRKSFNGTPWTTMTVGNVAFNTGL